VYFVLFSFHAKFLNSLWFPQILASVLD
jgi:hypothetical protein